MSISVVLPTSDDAARLPAFLESLLAQTEPPSELVIRDDRSVDDTVAIARALNAPFPVRIEINERRLGPGVNHGAALDDASADTVAIAAASDVWMPNRLEALRDATFVFTNAVFDGTTLWDATGFDATRRSDLLASVIAHPFVPASTTAFRTDLREVLAPVPEHVSFDWWLATLAPMLLPSRVVEEPLLRCSADAAAPPGVMPDDSGIERGRASVRGLREKVSVRDSDLHRQGRRAQAAFYDAVIERYESAGRHYLGAHGLVERPETAKAIADMRDRAAHLRIRGTLPDRRAKRMQTIVRELRSGRYTRYSSGIFSALQDLTY